METNELHNIILEQLLSKQPLWSNWMIGEKIGSGAYSSVYKITAERSGRVKVTRLAFGLPADSGIAYSDPLTLKRAIGGRRDV